MKSRILIISGILLLMVAVVLVGCSGSKKAEDTAVPPTQVPCPPEKTCAPCPTTAAPLPCPTAVPVPAVVSMDVPFQAEWEASGHNNVAGEQFRHWDDAAANPDGVPTSCAKCHTSAGFIDFAADGKVDKAVPAAEAQGVTCATCHSDAALKLTSVVFPSGAEIKGLGGEARCMTCHQGRASKVQIDDALTKLALADDDTVSDKLGFTNIHYFAAAATLYGTEVKGGYEYPDKEYDIKFTHVAEFDTCVACHNTHSLEVKIDDCKTCHTNVTSAEDLKKIRMVGSSKDYDGDGDLTEGIAGEIEGLQATLLQAIQTYGKEVAKAPIAYSADAYPYFFADANDNGKVDEGETKYVAWTGRLLKAAYNYQMSIKDPGAFAHNAKYIIELLYDSTEDLNTKLATPIDLAKANRIDSGHFAGSQMAFRDWDGDDYTVPARCAKCHSASGLPQYLASGGTLVYANGSLSTTGIANQPSSNGFMCSTCHDEANWPARYTVASVLLPSGKTVTFSAEKDDKGNLVPVDSNLCMLCHQARSSKRAVDDAIKKAEATDPNVVSEKLTFINSHYMGVAGVWFGTDAQIAYEYEGQTYVGANTHIPVDNKAGCVGCHDAHSGEIKADLCATCHPGIADVDEIRGVTDTTDWNGNGDVKEGVRDEYRSMRNDLLTAIMAYAEKTAGAAIVYDGNTNPYFFLAGPDGKPAVDDKGALLRYNKWTPALLKAAFNYQFFAKNPGAGAHNPKYAIQVIYDSINDLGGDVTKYTRP